MIVVAGFGLEQVVAMELHLPCSLAHRGLPVCLLHSFTINVSPSPIRPKFKKKQQKEKNQAKPL